MEHCVHVANRIMRKASWYGNLFEALINKSWTIVNEECMTSDRRSYKTLQQFYMVSINYAAHPIMVQDRAMVVNTYVTTARTILVPHP